jgi:hypothetical protein
MLSAYQEKYRLAILNKPKFFIYLLLKLPMGWLAGLKVKQLEADFCEVTVRHRWLNQNPFKSMYFAVLSMAAEMSTGLLTLMYIQGEVPVSMLVTGLEASFTKKAVGLITFRCEDGEITRNTIQQAIADGEGKTIVATTVGKNEKGEVVATFHITWSIKKK